MNTQYPAPSTQYQIPNILLVDDDLLILKSIGPALEGKGYGVVTSNNGADAIEIL